MGSVEEREVEARQGHGEGLVELHREVPLAAELEQDERADVHQAHLRRRFVRRAAVVAVRCVVWGGRRRRESSEADEMGCKDSENKRIHKKSTQ